MKGLKQYIKEAEEKPKDGEEKEAPAPPKPNTDWIGNFQKELKKVLTFINSDALEEYLKDEDLDGDYGKQFKEFLFNARKIIKAWSEELADPDKYGIDKPKDLQEFYDNTLTDLADQISDEEGGDIATNNEFESLLYGALWRRATGHSLSDRCGKNIQQ